MLRKDNEASQYFEADQHLGELAAILCIQMNTVRVLLTFYVTLAALLMLISTAAILHCQRCTRSSLITEYERSRCGRCPAVDCSQKGLLSLTPDIRWAEIFFNLDPLIRIASILSLHPATIEIISLLAFTIVAALVISTM